MCDGALAIMGGPEVIEPPVEVDELREIVDLQQELIGRLEARLAGRERDLQRLTVHRRLLAALEGVA